MSDESLAELSATAVRRAKMIVWGFYGITIVGGASLFVVYGGLGVVAAGLWLLAWILEVFDLKGRLELVTNKPTATVREEFSGPAMPPFVVYRHIADSVTELENGFEVSRSNVLSSTRIRFEAVESDEIDSNGVEPIESDSNPDDDSIYIHVFENDEHARTVTVSIEPLGARTEVVVSVDRRASALQVLLDRLYRPLERRALAAQGYVLVEDGTSPL